MALGILCERTSGPLTNARAPACTCSELNGIRKMTEPRAGTVNRGQRSHFPTYSLPLTRDPLTNTNTQVTTTSWRHSPALSLSFSRKSRLSRGRWRHGSGTRSTAPSLLLRRRPWSSEHNTAREKECRSESVYNLLLYRKQHRKVTVCTQRKQGEKEIWATRSGFGVWSRVPNLGWGTEEAPHDALWLGECLGCCGWYQVPCGRAFFVSVWGRKRKNKRERIGRQVVLSVNNRREEPPARRWEALNLMGWIQGLRERL